MLANRSVDALCLPVAKSCFRRLRDFPMVQLIEELEQRLSVGDGNNDIYLAEVHAARERFDDAARLYNSGGRSDLAVKMFLALKMFDKAEQWVTDEKQRQDILRLRADWFVNEGDKQKAVEIFLQLNDHASAFSVMKELGWKKRIFDNARKLDVFQKDLISIAAQYVLHNNLERFEKPR